MEDYNQKIRTESMIQESNLMKKEIEERKKWKKMF